MQPVAAGVLPDPHGATAFTPRLAGNIDLLSDAIGLPLTVLGQEVQIGEFRHTRSSYGRLTVSGGRALLMPVPLEKSLLHAKWRNGAS